MDENRRPAKAALTPPALLLPPKWPAHDRSRPNDARPLRRGPRRPRPGDGRPIRPRPRPGRPPALRHLLRRHYGRRPLRRPPPLPGGVGPQLVGGPLLLF